MTIERLTAALSDRYRIERELGQGGMATVYLAQDVRHSRKVALKVLKPELSAILGAERFLHEIKTTANLQHPHILSLFDSGEAGGQVYYVMPYVEGESLRARIDRDRQLPVEEAIRIAREVADALDYAHQHGVVHRDIKPENILLHGGHAMVADFGIALAASQSTGGNRMTETGMSLGTPHYMSPEQAMGEREITGRSDIYALGCVLYEMLTAEPPFVGATAQAIFARVLTEEPRSLTLQRKSIPPHVEAVVLQSLAKLPADRFPSAAEFARALGDTTFHSTGFGPHGTVMRAAQRHSGTGRSRVMLIATSVFFAGLAIWGWFRPAPPAVVSRFGLAFPVEQRPTTQVVITTDGSRLVYIGPSASGRDGKIWVKERDRLDATPLAGTEGAGPFAISPDSRWVAFTRGGMLWKTSLGGGPVAPIADSVFPAGGGISWLDDGTIVYTDAQFGLSRVPEDGGASVTLFPPDSLGVSVPVLTTPLPDARGVLFTICRSASCTPGSLQVLDLKTGRTKELIAEALRGWYLPTGHLIYVDRLGRLFAARFDLGSLTLETTPVPVMSDVALLFGVFPNLSFSTSGTMVMQSAQSTNDDLGRFNLVAVDRSGRHTVIDTAWNFRVTAGGSNIGMALSPDGRRLAIGLNTGSGDDIWIKQLPTGPLSRLTFDSGVEARPRWSPDGKWVTYLVNADTLERRRADGIGPKEGLRTPRNVTEGIWSPDGTWLIIRTGGQSEGEAVRDIFGRRTGDTTFIPLMADPQYNETSPAVSPDGRWITYVSNETGRPEVYVRPFPVVDGGKIPVSAGGGQAPLWAHSGRELFYVDSARNMMAVTVPPGPRFTPGTPRRLFTLAPEDFLNPVENYTPIEITPDDRRFLFLRLRRASPTGEGRYQYVENWFTELRTLTETH